MAALAGDEEQTAMNRRGDLGRGKTFGFWLAAFYYALVFAGVLLLFSKVPATRGYIIGFCLTVFILLFFDRR